MNPRLKFTLAFATGISVSTIYLNQSILHDLALDLNQSAAKIGLIATVTQLGYAFGLFFLVPLGDVVSKKKLILAKLGFLILTLLATSQANSLAALLMTSVLIGLFASTAQDLVPLAAELAPPHERGETIGNMMSGLLLGILSSRTLSGLIATHLGWRSVFSIFALGVAITWILVFVLAPRVQPGNPKNYFDLLRSVKQQFVLHPTLRSSLRTQGLLGFAFSAFWTNLSFHLGGPEFGLNSFQIGLFGIAGAAGALGATVAGKISDRRGPRWGIRFGAYLVAGSFAAMLILYRSLLIIALGAVVFDLGIQMVLVSHQSIIYALDPKSRSSINAVFMTGMFLAFALGSAISVQIQSAWGWNGVMGICLASAVFGMVSARVAQREAGALI
jgi:predicted MFS family arabinose efflux permease